MNSGLRNLNANALALDPTNSTTLYAGTWGSGVFRSVIGTSVIGTSVGVFRPTDATFYLDANRSGKWDGCGTDACISWGGDPTDQPKVGDWNGSGTTKIGVYRGSTGTWYLDTNGNGAWNGCAIDSCLKFGTSGDVPIVGKW